MDERGTQLTVAARDDGNRGGAFAQLTVAARGEGNRGWWFAQLTMAARDKRGRRGRGYPSWTTCSTDVCPGFAYHRRFCCASPACVTSACRQNLSEGNRHCYSQRTARGVFTVARLDDLFEFAEDRFTALASPQAAGFGLLIIQERIELLGGRMKIKSAKGSTFFIVVSAGEPAGPGVEVETRPNGRAGRSERLAEEDGDRMRVLVADDHEIVRQGLISLLSEEHTVKAVGEAANGREAVELTDRLEPDVVIMDVSMPLIDGDEATRQIKAHLPKTRVIALSMYNEPETVERMRRAGAERYVLKTAPSEELLAVIRGKQCDP